MLMTATMPVVAYSKAAVDKQFASWLQDDLWPEAKSKGVSASVFQQALSGVELQWNLPDLVPPGSKPPSKRPQSQAEFRSPAAYFSEKRLGRLTELGRNLSQKWSKTLRKIEDTYGVPGHILLAIWGMESNFGAARMAHSAMPVLATKAFMSTRKELFRRELLAALQILQKGYISIESMNSSWAGALGQPQFMPSVFLKYAVDFDGDGRRDIWNSVPDTLASIANYLAKSGWQSGRDWGFEADLQPQVFCGQEGPDRARPITKWVGQGISRINGKPFPKHELEADGMLLVPAGVYGPTFIVTPNFYVLKEYNNSDLYALFVGNLGDRIAYDSGAFHRKWGDVGRMLRSDIARMQRVLEHAGYDVGGADGLPGYKTRRSIGEWQRKNGHNPSCFPTPELLTVLR
ncbi:MAG: lytic murein transglycosylase [Gammaproteobacteria bacterium]